ncbi:MAG: hypothetical protein WCW35_12640 [Bacteroidota bacterium]|jgi:uncharacterized membrane protein (DUF4010 family)
MKNKSTNSLEQHSNRNGFPVQAALLLGVMILAVVVIILKISGIV